METLEDILVTAVVGPIIVVLTAFYVFASILYNGMGWVMGPRP